MALDVTKLYVKHHADHRLSIEECTRVFSKVRYVKTVDESKQLNADTTPKVIISSSGMATGGRVLHHLKAFGPDARNAIVFVGFQAGGTRGRDLVDGSRRVRIHGEDVPIRASVVSLGTLSAHADSAETLEWLRRFRQPPRRTFLVHGEPDALEGLRRLLRDELDWPVTIPEYRERVELA
jgi:metallo-beta-lactamase family protein